MTGQREATVRTALIGILRERGPLTDEELAAAYRALNLDGALPRQSPRAIVNRRQELQDAQVIVARWDLPDRRATD